MNLNSLLTHRLNALAGKSRLLDLPMIELTKAGVFLVVAVVALRWWSKRDRMATRYAWLFLMPAVLISLSRVYVGMHYVTDVLGGALTAAVAATFVAWLYRSDSGLNRKLVRIF